MSRPTVRVCWNVQHVLLLFVISLVTLPTRVQAGTVYQLVNDPSGPQVPVVDLYYPFLPGYESALVTNGLWTTYTNSLYTGEERVTGAMDVDRVVATDRILFGRQMTHIALYTNEEHPEMDFHATQSDGDFYYCAERDPELGQGYRLYEAGKLDMPVSGEIGDQFSWTSPIRGEWVDHDTGEATPWTGSAWGNITLLGLETVTVPAGTFADALKVRCETNKTRTVAAMPGSLWTDQDVDVMWLVKGVGYVKQEQWEWSSQVHGPGQDLHSEEGLHIRELLAFHRPGDPYLLGRTVASLAGSQYNSTGDIGTRQAVQDALVAAQESVEVFQGGMTGDAIGSFGCLAGAMTLDGAAVSQTIAALAADGAAPMQQFVRLEFGYDPDEIAQLGLSESDLAVYWWDDTNGSWFLNGTTTAGLQGAGALATMSEHENLVGYCGVDTVNHLVWANVNHASLYGVGVVPEPATMGILGLGGLALIRRRRTA